MVVYVFKGEKKKQEKLHWYKSQEDDVLSKAICNIDKGGRLVGRVKPKTASPLTYHKDYYLHILKTFFFSQDENIVLC